MFEIESWARSSSPLVNVLYHRLRMAKEVQAHMWISFTERVVRLAAGRMRWSTLRRAADGRPLTSVSRFRASHPARRLTGAAGKSRGG